jgi:hypothetical protein
VTVAVRRGEFPHGQGGDVLQGHGVIMVRCRPGGRGIIVGPGRIEFVEVTSTEGQVSIKPKTLVDADDVLTPEEEKIVRKGEAQLTKGDHVAWDDVKTRLKL